MRRYDQFEHVLEHINETEGGLDTFSRGYEKFGFTIEEGGIRYREWAPGVSAAFLIGDFSKFDQHVPFNRLIN